MPHGSAAQLSWRASGHVNCAQQLRGTTRTELMHAHLVRVVAGLYPRVSTHTYRSSKQDLSVPIGANG